MPDRTIERSSLEEEVFSRLPREAAELVAQLLLEAGDEGSRALSRRITERLGFSLSSAPPGAGVFFMSMPAWRSSRM